jgi:hypothetical protein
MSDDHLTGFVRPGMPSEILASVVYQVADGLIRHARRLNTRDVGALSCLVAWCCNPQPISVQIC